jgi:hypothetical protein
MAKVRLKDESMRARLVDACRVLRRFLKMTLEPEMHSPSKAALYHERWQHLDAVLAQFQQNPANFDSRAGAGLAERIHHVEPTKMLEGTSRSFFTLRPDGYSAGSYGPYDLAKTLEEAYRRKGYGDGPILIDEIWGEQYRPDGSEVDLICSELNSFFNGLSKDLLRHEQDLALTVKRKKTENVETYQQNALNRINADNPYTKNLFARRVCSQCFRLIPERVGETKTTIGTTCALHDPLQDPTVYRTGHNRQKATQASLDEQRTNKRLDIESNSKNPEWVPSRLHTLMKSVLLDVNNAKILSTDDLFDLTYRFFSTPVNDLVDTDELNIFLRKVEDSYPDIVKPAEFTAKVRELVKKGGHTPKALLPNFGRFLWDVNLPHHPNIVALYMQFFLEESWFAQEYAPDYYHSERGKGRPQKVDPDDIMKAYAELTLADPNVKRKAASILATQFQCTPARVRQILKDHQGE